jgi:RNA polymerase sigma factor (sigma-70 family)
LEQFVRNGSEDAFAALVQRHIGLVHSVAQRHTANPQHAEDITQAVFIILARKAGSLGRKIVLTGWLYHTARLAAANWQRAEARRVRREQEAFMQSTLEEPDTDALWQSLRPQLDEAMAVLGADERDAVVLRYFQNKSMAEVGRLLGLAENTAQKRVGRALEKLRKFFDKRGVNSTAAGIAETISTHSVQPVSVALAKTVTAVALAKGATASLSTLTLIKGALKIMAWTKAKTAIVTGAGILLVVSTGTVMVENHFFPKEPSYQGRLLSEWLADVDFGQPPDQKRAKAAEAIRKMGAKTLPFLLADLGDARYKRYSRKQDKRTSDRNSQATWAFDALGSIGKPAIPELTRILEQNPGYVPGALAGIGRDALPELLKALTNADFFVRDNTAAYLANAIDDGKITPAEAQAAFPIAINNLTYTSTNELFRENTRWRAAGLLGALELHPDVAVPDLIQGMDNTNPSVAAECAASLGKFGPDAAPAVPKMIAGINGSNLLISVQCAMSLGEVSYAGLGTNAPAAISALDNAANSTNNALRLTAKGALEQLGGRH